VMVTTLSDVVVQHCWNLQCKERGVACHVGLVFYMVGTVKIVPSALLCLQPSGQAKLR
jgi:hypothetical protein